MRLMAAGVRRFTRNQVLTPAHSAGLIMAVMCEAFLPAAGRVLAVAGASMVVGVMAVVGVVDSPHA